MPTYDYRCLTCDDVFERRITFAEADSVTCPGGHADVKRLLSTIAVTGRATASAPMGGGGGGCCGGACGCG